MGYFSDFDIQLHSDEFCEEYEEWLETIDAERISHLEEENQNEKT